MESWTLEWDRGRARVIASGAMLHDVVLRLEDGREVEPFAEAPWRDEPGIADDEALPAHLRRLGGEWPCVPFGTSPADPAHHGYGSNAEWRLAGRDAESVALACDYPAGHDVERLERTVRAVPGSAALEIGLTVIARRDCRLPIGLHPILRLPTSGSAALLPGAFAHGEVFLETFEPGVSRLRPGARFASLEAVPTADGGTASLAALPQPWIGEELVQLRHVDGRIALRDPATGAEIVVAWDPLAFPHCLLWISNGGRAGRPWNGRFRGLGVEPTASFFDRGLLGPDGGADPSDGRDFRAGEPWTTRYRIEAR